MGDFRDRRRKANNERRVDAVKPRLLILIVCEGEKTEPNYFKSFPKSNADVDIVPAAGNTLSVVEVADERRKEKDYDQIWCVFDRDSFPGDRFDNAIASAKSKNFKVAYSNEAFELWYILHYAFHVTPTSRTEFKRILSEHMGKAYKKNDPDMRDTLGDRINIAIKNAQKLRREYTRHLPNRDNPYTTVDELVTVLIGNTPR